MMPRVQRAGFTLVELLVSTALITTLLVILVGIVDQTSKTWRYTTSKVEQFRSARQGFEAITRRLAQATLNTYWDYDKISGPQKYVRQSELRFFAGTLPEDTAPPGATRVTHSVFFQAPLGFSDEKDFDGLETLLNTSGFFVEFASDLPSRPDFINRMVPPVLQRHRFRLMEFMQASNRLQVYTPSPAGWLKDLFTATAPATVPVFSRAENVIALVVLPKLAPEEDPSGTRLSPGYTYSSTFDRANDPTINSLNQLPPLVQITLVGLDEGSAAKIAREAGNGTMPELGLAALFKTGYPGSAEKHADRFMEDLEILKKTLADRRLTYRIFTTQVSIRGAKWSRD